MNKLETAQQLRLAAEIIESDKLWEYQYEGIWKGPLNPNSLNAALTARYPIRIKPIPTLIPLEASDIPPGSVVKDSAWPEGTWELVTGTELSGIRFGGNALRLFKCELDDLQINRSIPLLGKWDPTAWEPCSKPSTN